MARQPPRPASRAPLTWSVDRAEVFARCPRERWFERRAARAEPLRPRDGQPALRVHRHLVRLEVLAARAVRGALREERDRCRGETPWSVSRVRAAARGRLHDGWRQSASGAWRTCPGRVVHLDEHHYGVEVTRREARAVRETLAVAARHACRMEALAPLREAGPEGWRAAGETGSFGWEGAVVEDAPHFAHDDGGRLHLWDLHLGPVGDRELFRLHVHALLARRAWGADPERVRLHAADLRGGQLVSADATPTRMAEAEARLTASVRALDAARRASLGPRPDDVADAADGAPLHCPRCRFRGCCDAAAER